MMNQVYLVFEFNKSTMQINVRVYRTLTTAKKFVQGRLRQQPAAAKVAADEINQEWHLPDGSYLSIQQKPVQD